MQNPGKKVLITGGGRGIGREISTAFAKTGASVMIADKDQISGTDTCRQIKSEGGAAWFVLGDVSDPDEITNIILETTRVLGGIDILVNNAGFGVWKPAGDLTVEEWDSVLNTNLRGAFLCSREAARIMRSTGGGSIINIASTRAIMSEANSEAYAASKGGLIALTHAMAASYARDLIRVNCISPGWIETGDYKKLREIDHSQHLSGRVGKPSDIANACIFLAGNDFINGTNIVIDGGMTRKMIYEP